MDWTDAENDVIVAAYFTMLMAELSGKSINKAENNRTVQNATSRSRGSVEFKMANVSAVLVSFGQPFIDGYKPRFNFQMPLAEAVARWIALQGDWTQKLRGRSDHAMQEPPPLFIGTPPTLKNTPPPEELVQMLAVARKFDVAGRDERNRRLGRDGEKVVLHHEKRTLHQAGRSDLAREVIWVSEEEGDGAGYDIRSFTPNGAPRLIEVKTTNGSSERTPFHISRNERAVAEAQTDDWRLVRLYNFVRAPAAFELRPPLEAHVSLTPTSFLASFT